MAEAARRFSFEKVAAEALVAIMSSNNEQTLADSKATENMANLQTAVGKSMQEALKDSNTSMTTDHGNKWQLAYNGWQAAKSQLTTVLQTVQSGLSTDSQHQGNFATMFGPMVSAFQDLVTQFLSKGL